MRLMRIARVALREGVKRHDMVIGTTIGIY
jgi:hypothetical protein